jgi:hypothetical protein
VPTAFVAAGARSGRGRGFRHRARHAGQRRHGGGGATPPGRGRRDTYLVGKNTGCAITASISDTEGSNIVRWSGTVITSSLFLNNAVQLTRPPVRACRSWSSAFSYQLGANVTAGHLGQRLCPVSRRWAYRAGAGRHWSDRPNLKCRRARMLAAVGVADGGVDFGSDLLL